MAAMTPRLSDLIMDPRIREAMFANPERQPTMRMPPPIYPKAPSLGPLDPDDPFDPRNQQPDPVPDPRNEASNALDALLKRFA